MTKELQILKNRLILLQCKQRKDEGFRTLIGLYERPLFYYLRRFTDREEDAWDALQEAWIKVLRSIPNVKSAETLTPWLYRVVRNTMIDHQRRDRHWEPLPEDNEAGAIADETARQDSLDSETAEEVHWGLAKLASAEREVLTLFYLEEFQTQEIAEITGLPLGTIKSRLHRARVNLRAILEKERQR